MSNGIYIILLSFLNLSGGGEAVNEDERRKILGELGLDGERRKYRRPLVSDQAKTVLLFLIGIILMSFGFAVLFVMYLRAR